MVTPGKQLLFLMLALTLISIALPSLHAAFLTENEFRRVQISLKLFPRIIAVNRSLKADQQLSLFLVYQSDKNTANELAQSLKNNTPTINQLPVTTATIHVDQLNKLAQQQIAGLFLTERLDKKQFNTLVSTAKSYNTILFSPFSGDVEKGATVGISISGRVKPYFNIQMLKASNIEINDMLLRVSKKYE